MTLLTQTLTTEGKYRREYALTSASEISSIPTTDLECGSIAVDMTNGTIYGYNGTSWNIWESE